nr:hypothetical protein [Sphingomonas piscis]
MSLAGRPIFQKPGNRRRLGAHHLLRDGQPVFHEGEDLLVDRIDATAQFLKGFLPGFFRQTFIQWWHCFVLFGARMHADVQL